MQKAACAVLLSLVLGTSPLQAQSLATTSDISVTPPRLSAARRAYYRSNPAAWSALLTQLQHDQTSAAGGPAADLPRWPRLVNRYPGKAATQPVLLMDGTVIVHEGDCSRDWYKLTPDAYGDYSKGAWSRIARLPDGYAPLQYAAQVLADGRVMVAGGEYNVDCGGDTMTNQAAVYDPMNNSWKFVAPPKGFVIADAPSVVLADTTFLVGWHDTAGETNHQMAKFDPKGEGAWRKINPKNEGGYSNNEVGWTLLPSGKVFALSVYCEENRSRGDIFDPSTNKWTVAGYTQVGLVDCNFTDEVAPSRDEVGPNLLRPDGKVVLFGGRASADKGADTVIYNPSSGALRTGPSIPVANYTAADAPAALLPNGNILFAASPGFWRKPAKFFQYVHDGVRADRIVEVGTDASARANSYYLMVLPTGQVLATSSNRDVKLFKPMGPGATSPVWWAPRITSRFPANGLERGKEYDLGGLRLNGVSEGGAYGDEHQTSTNYPIIRLTEKFTKKVFYCRTTRVESRSVAPDAVTTAHFLVPKEVPASGSTNAYALDVVANGVASPPVNVVIR